MQGRWFSLPRISTAPLALHVVIQTTSGQVGCPFGDARTVRANTHLPRATVAGWWAKRHHGYEPPKFFGEYTEGNQTLDACASARGFPLRPASKAGKSEAGVL